VTSPLSAPGAKLTLFVGLTMSFVGFVGVSRSMGALTAGAAELAPAGGIAAVDRAAVALMEALIAAPLWRVLSIANLLASGLLIVASLFMTARAKAAPWWAAQALLGNVGYSLVSAVAQPYLLEAHRPMVMAALEAAAEAQSAAQGVPPLGTQTLEGLWWTFLGVTVLVYLLMAAFYFGLFRLTRRKDVLSFVQRE
jgi:hypothetical protein